MDGDTMSLMTSKGVLSIIIVIALIGASVLITIFAAQNMKKIARKRERIFYTEGKEYSNKPYYQLIGIWAIVMVIVWSIGLLIIEDNKDDVLMMKAIASYGFEYDTQGIEAFIYDVTNHDKVKVDEKIRLKIGESVYKCKLKETYDLGNQKYLFYFKIDGVNIAYKGQVNEIEAFILAEDKDQYSELFERISAK